MSLTLSPAARASLRALCETLAPDTDPDALTERVARRATRLPAPTHVAFQRALEILAGPLAGRLLGGRGRSLAAETPPRREAWLRRMERSRLPVRRAALQALRRLVLYTAWADRDGPHRDGPLPDLPWVGPLPGTDRKEEATLRVAEPGRWRAPPPSRTAADIVNATSLDHGAVVRADVCVIGSGAGGSVAACRLAEAGLSVIVIEEGGHLDAPDFPVREGDATDALYADAGLRTTDDFAISLLQGRCVGGGTTVNWLLVLRPRPWAMHEWLEAHGAELLGERILVPEIERVEAEIGAGIVPAEAHSAQNRLLLEGCARLGWKVEHPRISARGCVRAGTCGLGCRYGARRGPLSVWLPRAAAAGARTFADVRADRIVYLEQGGPNPLKRVEATLLDQTTGAPRGRIDIEAPLVVLAAGAIGTPALLRRSGLGNAATGRFLRLHPTTATFASFDHDVMGGTGIPQSAACTQFHDEDDGWGFWIECPPVYRGLAAASIPGIGTQHAAVLDQYPRLAAFIILVRDGMRGESQGAVTIDRAGRTRIRYRMGSHERRRMAEGLAASARIQLAAGAQAVRSLHVEGHPAATERQAAAFAALDIAPNRMTVFSAHVNGTCRMGGNRRLYPCDPEGRVRGAPGVFVADGSLFPSAPGVNPQITIMAVASQVASRIAG